MYTCTIFVGQGQMLAPRFTREFRERIRDLSAYTGEGLIRWIGLAEAIDIWVTEFGSEPNLYSYLYGDITH